jgi:IS5 family transposase
MRNRTGHAGKAFRIKGVARSATARIVDAIIISAPKEEKRDPEMHQTAKGNQGYFRTKAHLGVDSKTKLIHTIRASVANVPDVDALPYLLHGRETRVWGDQGYQGRTGVIRGCAPGAKDFTNRRYRRNGFINETEKAKNRNRSQVRAKVEHIIGVIKRIFGFQKLRFRGLAKSLDRLEVTAALANLFSVRRRCSMRRTRVGKGCRIGRAIQLSTDVSAETRVVTQLDRDPTKFFAFITTNSEFP